MGGGGGDDDVLPVVVALLFVCAGISVLALVCFGVNSCVSRAAPPGTALGPNDGLRESAEAVVGVRVTHHHVRKAGATGGAASRYLFWGWGARQSRGRGGGDWSLDGRQRGGGPHGNHHDLYRHRDDNTGLYDTQYDGPARRGSWFTRFSSGGSVKAVRAYGRWGGRGGRWGRGGRGGGHHTRGARGGHHQQQHDHHYQNNHHQHSRAPVPTPKSPLAGTTARFTQPPPPPACPAPFPLQSPGRAAVPAAPSASPSSPARCPPPAMGWFVWSL